MTVVLERKITSGSAAVAALVRNTIVKNGSATHVWVSGSRIPVILLIRRGDDVTAFSIQGDPVTLSQVDDICPGAVAEFMSPELP